MGDDLTQWRFSLATRQGTSHQAVDIPCQDAALCRIVSDSAGVDHIVAIASDGAGSSNRSDFAAQLCCWSFVRYVEELFEIGLSADTFTIETFRIWITDFVSLIEKLSILEGLPFGEYYCTVNAAILSDIAAVYLQVGDGMIAVRDFDDSDYGWVFEPDNGEYDNQTFFLSQKLLSDNVHFEKRIYARAGMGVVDLALMTDGIQKLAFNRATWTLSTRFFDPLFSELYKVASPDQNGEVKSVSSKLNELFQHPLVRSRCDDDMTIILATRKDNIGRDTNGQEAVL